MNANRLGAGENQFNPRSPAILAVAKADNLNLDIVTITSSQDAPEYYRKLNRLAKVPTFVSADGFVLSECIAIALYSTSVSFFSVTVAKSPICGRRVGDLPCTAERIALLPPNQPFAYLGP